MKRWYEIKAKADDADSAEIWIYDEIGAYGISAKGFLEELQGVKGKKLDVRINSPGGSVFDGIAIFNALERQKENITVYVDGIAASIASLIALAGEKTIIAENGLFMIHNPFALAIGDHNEMAKTAEILNKIREAMLNSYSNKTGRSREALIDLMEKETWFTADEALENGFVDEISKSMSLAACADFGFAKLGFKNVPACLSKQNQNDIANVADNILQAIDERKGSQDKLVVSSFKEKEMEKIKEEEKKKEEIGMVSNNAAEIAQLAHQYGYSDKTAEWIKAGRTVDEVSREILALKGNAKPLPQSAAELVNLTEKEQQQYSLVRALHNAVQMQEGGGKFDGFEKEISDEIARKLPPTYKAKGGFFVPLNLGNIRASLDSKTATKGVETVFDVPGGLIELLRNSSVVARLGARTLAGLTNPVTFTKQSGAMSIYWTGENPGSDVTASDVAFKTVTLTPKTCQGTTSFSRQLLAQSNEDIEAIVRQDFAIGHALGWDKAALHGLGSAGEPVGIYNVSGVNAVAMGGVPVFGKLVDMSTECAKDNALLGNLGWTSTPGMAGKLMQTLVASSAGSRMIWEGNQNEGNMVGYRAIASNQVNSTLGAGADEHGIIFGNWADLIIGMWGAMEIIVDPYAKKKQGLIEVTSFQMVDIIVRHEESFCVATGAKIA